MRSTKWCHFQWPWTNHNPVFKVTPVDFDAKYLANGYRYGHSYYRRRIGNRTHAFEWHQFQWLEWPLSQISRSPYYSTSNNSQMVQDRAIVTIWRTNRKSYMVYRTAPFSMTLTDPKPRFQTMLWRWISPKWLQIRPLWKVSRKPYPSFQMVPLSITFNFQL